MPILSRAIVHFGLLIGPMIGPIIALTLAAPANAKKAELSADGTAIVTIMPTVNVARSAFKESLLAQNGFTGWSVDLVTGLPGTITIQAYDAGWDALFPQFGGGGLLAFYQQATDIPDGNELNWIQVIHTNRPLGGPTVPYIDPRPNDDTLPFYWTRPQADTYGDETTIGFSDFSTRNKAGLATIDPIYWRATLFPVHDDGFVITIGNGLRWGWRMRSVPVVAVPEPDSWLLMIAGLGLAGALLRTRRKTGLHLI